LTLVFCIEDRKIICQMKTSYDLLEIKWGRYKKIKREEHICCHCTLNEIEVEIISFLIVPRYIRIWH
jgi:hypothetical protein